MASSRLCSIPGCRNRCAGAGYCAAHRWRIKKYGDPLHGGPLKEYGLPLAFLNNTVLPYDGDECLTWPFSKSSFGYGVISIKGRRHSVHRYVCEQRKGPPPTSEHEAAHSCGKGHLGCVAPNHLSWKTPSANQADRLIHGTDGRGEKHHMAKLTESDVRDIRKFAETVTYRKLASVYGVHRETIRDIVIRRNWGWLD